MKKKIIALATVYLFLFSNVAWASTTGWAPFTEDSGIMIYDGSRVTATVSGPTCYYTYVDTDGVLQGEDAAAAPSARIESDGLLCEGQAKNLVAYSTDFSQYTAEDDIAASANVNGPEGGTNTAYTVTDNGGNANDWLYYSVGNDLTADAQYTMSVYVKEGTATSFSLLLRNHTDSSNDILIDYQWSSNVLSQKAADAGTSTVSQLGSTTWWRITATAAANIIDNGDTYRFCVSASEVGTDPAASKTVIFYGAQLEESPYVTSYIPTSGAARVRWSQEGAIDTTDLLASTNTTSFKLSAASGNSFFQSDDITLTDYAGVLGTDLINATTLNGDMEDDSNWENSGFDNGETNERSSTQVWEGSYSRHASVDNQYEGFQQVFTVVSGTNYRVDFMYWIVSGELQVAGVTGRTNLGGTYTTTGSWQRGILSMVASASGTEYIIFRSYTAENPTEFYIDDVRISPITTTAPAYRIILEDGDGATITGFIGYPDVAETLAPDLWDANKGEFTEASLLGSELISNGDCSSDDFTKGTGWAHDAVNNEYDCDGSQVADSDLTQNIITAAGLHKVVFTVKNYSAGNVCGYAYDTEGTDVSANNTYTQYIYATASGVAGVRADANFVGTIDDVSIKKIDISWEPAGANTMEIVSDELKISRVDSSGAFVYLTDAKDLSANVVVQQLYKSTIDAYTDAGDTVQVGIYGGQHSILSGNVAESKTTYNIYQNAENTSNLYLKAGYGMGAGEVIYADNVTLKAVRHGGTDAVRVYTSSALTTEGWTESGTFDYDEGVTDGFNVTIEFIEANGIYWPHANLWATDWATDMDPQGAMFVDWTPGYAAADSSATHGVITVSDAIASVFAIDASDDVESQDGTNTCTDALAPVNGTTYEICVTWDEDIDADGSLEIFTDQTASGDEEEYDDSFGAGTNLIIGFNNPYPFHLKSLRFINSYARTGKLLGGWQFWEMLLKMR